MRMIVSAVLIIVIIIFGIITSMLSRSWWHRHKLKSLLISLVYLVFLGGAYLAFLYFTTSM